MGNTAGGTAPAHKHDYLAYMMRLWWDNTDEGVWRASLEDPHTGERTGFASLEALFAFLRYRVQPGQGNAIRNERGQNTAPHGASQGGTISSDTSV
jgi:hypothetical protein